MGPMAWMVCEFDLVQEAAPLDVFILVEQGSPPLPSPKTVVPLVSLDPPHLEFLYPANRQRAIMGGSLSGFRDSVQSEACNLVASRFPGPVAHASERLTLLAAQPKFHFYMFRPHP